MEKNTQQKNTFYQLLTRNMIITVILVSFAPMILVICILLHQFDISYHEKTHAHLKELIEKHKQHIDSFLVQRLSNIQYLAESSGFDELTDVFFLEKKLAALQKEYSTVFTDLGVVNEQGVQIAYAGPYKLEGARYSKAPWFKNAIASQYYISDVFTGLREHPHFIVTVKKTHQGSTRILRATVDFRAFNTLVGNLRIGKTGFAYILNRKGKFQTNPTVDFKPCMTCYTYFLEQAQKTHGDVHISDRIDESGIKNIYGAALLKEGNWVLIYKQETADAFSDLRRMVNVAIAIFIMGGLSIIAMAVLLTKKMVLHIKKSDTQKEKLSQQVIETGKLASVGELAAGIAHEINNPVAIMVEEAGWIEDLLEEEELGRIKNIDEIKRALKQINSQGERCKEITHKLLSFARKTDSTLTDVQINDQVAEIVELSSQMAKHNKVVIITDLQENLPFITISPSEMQQVLLNLINNALDAMAKNGGTIKIATKLSRLEKDHIVITIEDNGPGIPESNLTRIFDPFFTTKPVGKGTGLGLSICYGIIEKMGGKIDAGSTVDMGAKFRIWIPIQKNGEESNFSSESSDLK